MAIERLIMCVRSGSNSAIYYLTNLVAMGSRSQMVVFLFHDQLAHIDNIQQMIAICSTEKYKYVIHFLAGIRYNG